MADFQVVNKKKKSRKRRSDTVSGTSSAPSGGLRTGDSSMSASSTRNRRKSSCSMPVSDKSDSSDLDSVHSLPVSAKLGSNVNAYAERAHLGPQSPPKDPTRKQNSPTPFLNSVEHFPELCRVNNNSNNVNNVDNTVSVNSVCVSVCRRPAVIIPVSNKDPFYEVSGLTFGFEVNEQLLALDNEVGDSDVKSNSTPKVGTADSFTARFVAPVIEFNYNHDKIVSYVGQGKFIIYFVSGHSRFHAQHILSGLHQNTI